jgi:hypothetical protein
VATAGSLLALVILQTLIGLAWWRWLRRAAQLTAGERLLCTLVLSLAQVVGVSLLLGWVGALSPLPLIGAVMAVSAALACFPGHAVERGHRVAMRPVAAPATLALAALLVVTLALTVSRGVLSPDPGWDGLKYHLPITALMRQTHGLDLPPARNSAIASYPRSGEIWAHWLLAVGGDDRWLSLQQLPFLPLAMLAVWCAARRLGSSPAAAGMAALFFPFAPVVLAQVTTAYTDVLLASLVLAAVALVLAARDAPSIPVGLALGAALGLLIGTKFTGVALAALLFGALALAVLPGGDRRRWRVLMLVGGLALLLGGDAYLRNWRQHGNPVFPFRTSVLGRELPGPKGADNVYGAAETRDEPPLHRLLQSWSAVGITSHSGLYGGFGLAWPFLAVVGLVSLGLAARERDRRRLLVYGLGAVLFVATPLNFRVRFVLSLLGFGGLALAHVLDRATPRWRAALIGAVLAVASIGAAQAGRVHWRALADRPPGRADLCHVAPPVVYRPAYAWLRQHGGGRPVLTFPGPELFPFCLWTPTVENAVYFVDADDPQQLRALAVAHRDAILFLQDGTPVFGHYLASDRADWSVVFADPFVTLVTAAPDPLPR